MYNFKQTHKMDVVASTPCPRYDILHLVQTFLLGTLDITSAFKESTSTSEVCSDKSLNVDLNLTLFSLPYQV